MQMAYLGINQLTPAFRQGALPARVSRMWDFHGGRDGTNILHVDLVLIDPEGSAIYAEIGAADIEAKKPLPVEGEIYVFSRFRVWNSKPTYNPVDFKFMINITCYTMIEKPSQPPPDVPLYVYRFTKLSNVTSLIGENKYFLDVIGVITGVSEADSVLLKNQSNPTHRRVISIKDLKQTEMKIYIWGERADEFDDEQIMAISKEKPIIAIFVGLLAKKYLGETSLSGNTDCKWYINPEVPEVQIFLNGLKNKLEPIARIDATTAVVRLVVPRVEPKQKTIAEIRAMNPYDFPIYPEGFRCIVTLTRCNVNQTWWFPSCNRCSKTSLKDGTGYKCPRDQCTGFKFKYKPCNFGTDGTGEIELVFFDDMGTRLYGKDVRQLLRSSRDSGPMPSDVAAQVGQKYQFTINVTTKAFEGSCYSYDVKRIDCAYGRQPEIPAIHMPCLHQPTTEGKVVAPGETSSSIQSQEREDNSNLVLSPQGSPSTAAFKIKDAITPPPPISPVNTPIVDLQISSSKSHEPERQISARKRLFKDGDLHDSKDAGHVSSTLEDDDEDNVNSTQYLSDSKKTRR